MYVHFYVSIKYKLNTIVYNRGNARKKVFYFNTMNIKFGIVGNDNLGSVVVGLQILKR